MLLVGHMPHITLSGNVSVLRKMSSLVMKGVLIPSHLYCVTSARSDCSRWKKLAVSVAGNEIS
ncbi:Uncharacterized protein APZ42_007882 [Daphnia magna]|nr:Uncharacterized protein APZ42_007882 [Daphnia magna]